MAGRGAYWLALRSFAEGGSYELRRASGDGTRLSVQLSSGKAEEEKRSVCLLLVLVMLSRMGTGGMGMGTEGGRGAT